MNPIRLGPNSFLKFVLSASLLMCLPSPGHAQVATTATYMANNAGSVNYNQKLIAVGTDGYTRFIVQEDAPDNGQQLTYVRCLDQNCDTYNTKSWEIAHISPFAFSIAVGPDGYARIAYQIFTPVYDSAGEYHFATVGFIQCFDDDCGSSTNDSFVDYAAYGSFASVTVGSDGTAYIAYDNGNVGDGPQGIGLATCSGGGCSTSTLVTGISIFDLTDATIAMGSDGNPVVAYADDHFSSDGYFTFISSTGHYYEDGTDTVITSDASLTDLSIGPGGFARIYFQNHAYWDSSATPGAYFVECGNVSCSSAAVNPISISGVGSASYGSLAIGAYGNAWVEVDLGSYPDSSYYVECTVADCSSFNSSLISADSGDSASLASIAVGADGLPRMIMEDTNGVVYQGRATVSAMISQRTSSDQTVSSDDAAEVSYQLAAGTSNLGNFANGTYQGCAIGIETVGTISPSSYAANVIIHRTIVNTGVYENSTDSGGEVTNADDTSDPSFRDDDPQSGGSDGKVYDLDAPGIHPPDGNKYRLRTNFYDYATLPDGTRISSNYYFYVRLSCTKTSSGYQFVNDVTGDNQTGAGSTSTSWNLQ
jgi:hypothetical protein